MTMYPLKFEPILKTKVWGGEKIAKFKNISTNLHGIGESWEISAYTGDDSVVSEGPLAGKTLTELVSEYKGKLVGEHVYAENGNEFPLLIKFIDARDDLSIQVHPDDKMAAAHHPGMRGKTEMWYVVDTDPGAQLLVGLKNDITPEEYERRIADNTITDVLVRHDVKKGDVFFLPAGRIHAICSGCFISEIQQTSDLTYRIYDYNRPGLDGKPRELHTELAKEAIDYKVYPSYKTEYTPKKNACTTLVDCKYFTTDLYELDSAFELDLKDVDSFLVVMCTSGSGLITDSEGNKVSVRKGETLLVPACCQGLSVVPSGEQTYITSKVR